MKKVLLMCMMALGIGVDAQILVNEGFEGSSLPTGWTASALPSSVPQPPSIGIWTSGAACAGNNVVYRNIYQNSFGGVASQSIVYTSTNSNATDLVYSFKYLAKGFSSSGAIKGSLVADYSVDGGATWVQLGTTINMDSPNSTPIPCTTISGTIPAASIPVGVNFKFRLTGSTNVVSDFYLGFDEVKLNQTITAPPGCTVLTTPAAGATGVSRTPTLAWSPATGATGYLLNVGTTPGGTNILNNVDVGNVNSYVIPAANTLNYSTMYYIRVVPTNNLGTITNCSDSSFTTVAVPCPSVSAPSTGATSVSVTPTFTWTAAAGATGYRLTIGTTAGGSDVLNNFDIGNALTYTHNIPLNYNTKYYYTVNSYSATSVSSGCTERNFITKTLCPSVTAPSANATGISITPTFTWSSNSDATGYRISVGSTAGGTDILNNVDVGNVLTYTYNGIPLNYNTKYYYTVNAYNGAVASLGCTERNFTTITLCPPVSAPASGATGMSLTPTFSWSAVQGATGYRLTVGTTAGGSDILSNFDLGNITTYVYSNVPLNYNTKYYYTINAYSGATVSSACTDRSFITMALCPVVSFPASNATGVSQTPSINWSAVSGVSGYRLSVGTVAGGTDVINNLDLGNVTSYNFVPALNLNTSYFYTVNAYTSTASSVSCTERKFTTTTVAAPANDECFNAIALTVSPTGVCANAVTGSTVNATLSSGTAPSCSSSAVNDDVWYSFIAAGSTHLVTVLYADNATTTQIYSGSCDNLVAMSCFDGAFGNSNVLLSNLISGQKYYVRVYSTSTTASTRSAFQICVTTPSVVANDTCATAIAIPCNGIVNGNNAVANDDVLPASACGATTAAIYKGVWYTVTATVDGAITVDACGSKFDTYLRVYSGNCSSLVCFANTSGVGYADTGCTVTTNNASKLTFNGVAGTTYYIYLSSYAASQMGDYSIAVTQSCTGLGVNDLNNQKDGVKLYPNPFSDVLNISDVNNVKSISIVDIAGRLVKTIEKPSSVLHLGELKSGMYVVILNMNDGSKQTMKAIKK